MKRYQGTAQGEVFVMQGKKRRKLEADVAFGWGHTGPAVNALARALLSDALGNTARAAQLYMRFKYRALQGLKKDMGWTMTEADVL